jgi:hypothetical protein
MSTVKQSPQSDSLLVRLSTLHHPNPPTYSNQQKPKIALHPPLAVGEPEERVIPKRERIAKNSASTPN